MDSITHIVLGATIGEALAGRKLGKKAMLLGAVANSLPDIDFIASSWLDTAHDVAAHRGITHSFLFVVIIGALLAAAGQRLYRRDGMSFGRWMFFFGFEMLVHIVLDAFNAYGTGWFEPFSHYRVSFNVLFVADPLYTLPLIISVLMLLVLKRGRTSSRRFWVGFGLILSTAYLYYCILNKYRVDKWVEKDLAQQHIPYKRYFTTPTPLNNWLWYVVAEDSTGYYTGYISMFDRKYPMGFPHFRRNERLLAPIAGHEDVQALLRFSDGYYTVQRWRGEPDSLAENATGSDTLVIDTTGRPGMGQNMPKDTLVFNVLRFGQMKGWEEPRARFVFHYFLEKPDENGIILQRGRFTGWDRAAWGAFLRRIRGN